MSSIGCCALAFCLNLRSVALQNGLEEVGESAFAGCRKLSAIAIPPGVRRIGRFAFAGCPGIARITIPLSTVDIGEGAFSRCPALTVDVEDGNPAYGLVGGMLMDKTQSRVLYCPANQAEVEIPMTVERIGAAAFSSCEKMSSINFPERLSSIGDEAFGSCTGLVSVVITRGVTNIGSRAFHGCSQLETVTLLPSVIGISSDAFSGCYSLKCIVTPTDDTNRLSRIERAIGRKLCVSENGKLTVLPKEENVNVEKSALPDPIRVKIPDLSRPVGPIHVVVGVNADKVSHCHSYLLMSTNALMRCDDKQFVTVAVPVDHVRATDVTNVVCSLQGTNVSVRVLKDINALLVTGEAKNVRSACEAIRICDDSANRVVERSWCLKYAKAKEVKRMLDEFAAGFKTVAFNRVPPRTDTPANVPDVASADELARGILSVKADEKANWLTVCMAGSASGARWSLLEGWVKSIDVPSKDENLIEQKYVLRHQDPTRVVLAINALLGEGVAAVAAGETNVVVAHVREDSFRRYFDIVSMADLRFPDWNITLDVRRVPDVKTLQEARRKAGEIDAEGGVVCRVTSCVMDGRTGVLTGRLDKDDPETEFRLTAEPRWAGNKDLSFKWEILGCEKSESRFQMSGATVLRQDQATVIGGMMRSESRGFLGLGASDDLNTAYLLQITVSEKDHAD